MIFLMIISLFLNYDLLIIIWLQLLVIILNSQWLQLLATGFDFALESQLNAAVRWVPLSQPDTQLPAAPRPARAGPAAAGGRHGAPAAGAGGARVQGRTGSILR